MKWIRHGDVILEKVNDIPKGKKKEVKSIVLAEGEVTGHKHILSGEQILVTENKDSRFIETLSDTKLVHEEHNTLDIPKGQYKVYIQREVDLANEVRQVMD